MNHPINTGVVGIEDLPVNKILIGLKEPFKKDILKHLSRNIMAKSLNTKPHTFYNFKNNEKVPLKFVLDLSNHLIKQGFSKFSHKEIEKNIEIIGTKRGNVYIRNPKLPFKLNNREGAYFISAILFDGGIDRQFKPHYGNLDLGMRTRVVSCARNIFGELTSKEVNAQRGYFIRFPKTMGIILNNCFGIGVGNKMYCHNKIPDFIFKLDKNAKSCFIRQAFDDDGSVSVEKKMIRIVGVTDVKKQDFYEENAAQFDLLDGIKHLLLEFGIDSNPLRTEKSSSNTEYRKKGEFYRHIFTFSITGKKNLELFYNKIGFNLDYKMKRLGALLKSYKVEQLRKGEIHKIAFEICKSIQKNITIPNMAKGIKRSYRQTVRVIKVLEKKGLIELKKPSINVGGRRLPAVYQVAQKNGKFIGL